MTFIVTGSEGFIGSRFCERAEEMGFCLKKYDIRNGIPFDFNEINKGISCVFHFGALTDTTSKNIQDYFEKNCLFSQRLIDSCAKQGVQLVFSSSASLYGEQQNKNPLNLYAWSKWVSESYGMKFDNFTALRYFNVYGIGEHKKEKKMTSVIYQNINNKKIKLFKGKPKRDFIFVDDVVQANLQAFRGGQMGTYDVGRGEARPFEDIAKYLNIEIEYIDNPISFGYQSFTQADRQKWLTGWAPNNSLKAGIEKTVNFYGGKI